MRFQWFSIRLQWFSWIFEGFSARFWMLLDGVHLFSQELKLQDALRRLRSAQAELDGLRREAGGVIHGRFHLDSLETIA